MGAVGITFDLLHFRATCRCFGNSTIMCKLTLYRADADLSADGKLLAVSNMLTGFEVFAFKTLAELEPLCLFSQGNGAGLTMPVRLIHGGNALIGGTSDRRMLLWDINTCRKQRLIFDGELLAYRLDSLLLLS